MNRLWDHAEATLGRRKSALIEQFAALAEELIPGSTVEIGRDEIRIRGPGLMARMLSAPSLRFFPRMSR